MFTRTKISPAPPKRILLVLLIFLVVAVYIFGADGEQFLDIVKKSKGRR